MSTQAQPAPQKPAPGPVTLLGRLIPRPIGDFKWVYLWGLPLRAMHWIAAIAIVVLVVTGLYIGGPYFVGSAEPGFIMSKFRLVHYLAAAALVMTGIVRVYWLVAGDRFERFGALFPVRSRDLANLVKTVKFYLMIQPEKAPHYLGHNPLQQLNYTLVFLVASLEVVTGFILFGQAAPTGWIYATTNWIQPYLGGLQGVRIIHHSVTWFFLIFIPAHVYLAFRADIVEGGGTVSSIITGGRFFEADRHYEDE